MKKLSWLDAPDIRGVDRQQSDRRTAAVNEFDLVGNSTLVDMDNRADIATTELLMVRFAIENDERMFDYHLTPARGPSGQPASHV